MSSPILAPLALADAAALRAFETDNRAFFEATINARPAGAGAVAFVYDG